MTIVDSERTGEIGGAIAAGDPFYCYLCLPAPPLDRGATGMSLG
jgi:hypothetical protein